MITHKKVPTGYAQLLDEFISFKSISTDIQFKDECEKTATWLKDIFESSNFEVKIDHAKNSNPLVMAKYITDKNAETILVYGHYDVQPANEADGWKQSPFKATEQKGRIIARGAIDNKGQVLVHIYNVLELIKEDALKYNVIFMIEGNEESGNKDIAKQLKKYKKFLAADYVLISDGEIAGKRPTIESSFRGGANMTVSFTTAPNDFHSGIYGGAVPSASQSLVQVLAKLKDDKNKVRVPGFYKGLKKPSKQEKESNESLATQEEILKLAKTKTLLMEKGMDFYTQVGLRPTLEISGINSGYTGVGYLNIVPGSSEARINVRTVAPQNTAEIMESIKDYIISLTPDYVKASFEIEEPSAPIDLNLDNDLVSEMIPVLEKIYRQPIAIRNVGGSIPIVADFRNMMGMEVISVSLANEDCNMHGVDENFHIGTLEKGLKFSRAFFEKK